jgi:hypothetical protein
MQSSKYVFISFKSEERNEAYKFFDALKSSGYLVWWAEDLQCGQEWHGEIDKAIEEAGAVIVLWSSKSYTSPWVKHEASQAMAKKIYAPVRTELINIESPFSRIQATDIINWNGEINHPGFQNLLVRLKELLPPPIPLWRQSTIFLWKQKAVIVLLTIAVIALLLLLRQSAVLNKQIDKQEETFQNVQKQSKALQSQSASLQVQLQKQDELIMNARNQSNVLDKQLNAQRLISSNVQSQNVALKAQIQKQEQLSKQSGNIISKQVSLSDSMDRTSQMIQNNLKIQEQSLVILKKTSEDAEALSYPVVNGLAYQFKMRVYVEGTKKIWQEKSNQAYKLLAQNDTISSFVQKRIYKFSKQDYTKYDPYQTFFSNISVGIGVSTVLNYEIAGKPNSIVYFENGANNFRFWSAPKNIYFNPQEEYFESEFYLSSGAVKSNPNKVATLYSLFDSAQLVLIFRFVGDEKHTLPVSNLRSEFVRIKKIELSDFSQIRYGNNFQFLVKPSDIKIAVAEGIPKFTELLENTGEHEKWRYCVARVPLTRN